MDPKELLKELVTFNDAVELLEGYTNANTLRHYVQQRRIPYVKLFGRIYFRLSDLVAYIDSCVMLPLPPRVRERKTTYAEDRQAASG